MLAVANVGGIGYGFFGLAAWTAFKFWAIWVAVGLATFVFSTFSS